jgi:anti-sigma-K factor RskA
MTHAEMDELYELYVLGALEPDAASDIDQHVAEQCAYCLQRLRDAMVATTALSSLADEEKPPARLRQRIIGSLRPRKQSSGWWYALGGLAAACLALVIYSLSASSGRQGLRDQVAELQHERNELRAAVAVLSEPQTRAVQFGIAENGPHGRVFLNRSGGVVFVGSQLPEVASDRTFELWVIPARGAPRPAGVFRGNVAGNFVDVAPRNVNTSDAQAVAVTVEPLGGSPAPTTKPFLIVPVG